MTRQQVSIEDAIASAKFGIKSGTDLTPCQQSFLFLPFHSAGRVGWGSFLAERAPIFPNAPCEGAA
jgi:hypothetical protein